jgi:hypothetical protein
VGTGATAHCSVVGGLERIDIIDPGFDYLEEPEIIISGGNGKGASAKSKLVSFDHLVDFNAISGINTTLNTIKTIEYHKFRDSEEVIYTTNGATEVSGLIPNSSYFVSVQDEYTVKLYKSFQDSVLKSNPISIIDAGAGTHTLRCKNKKRKIGSIIVDKAGENYQNKKNVVSTSGINTASNTITAINHGYLSGEIVKYSSSGTTIGGLTNNSSYYVTVLNKDQFKLSQVGLGTDIKEDFYYQTKQFIDLTNLGTGNHIFNYPPINVTVKGRIGVSTFTSQDFNATIQPIFRGKINSVSIESGGFGYGSEEIINYNKQPEFILNSGSGAQVTPIISNGVIVDVVINSAGGQYNSPPNLVIDTAGDGNGAILSPVISNGSISEIKIISGGIGYVPGKTSISVISSGSGANFYSKTKIWKINLVQRLIETKKITDDDGILDAGNNEELGLEYTHAYAPRNLRKSILASKFEDGKKIAVIDLVTENNSEVNSAAHSPIIGWAYDGNPIYGPYGYDSISGGTVRCMVPGYVEVLEKSPYRPSYSLYPDGFFIDDYEYTGDGDLDEFNGRFCVTPDYPNGVYAYFCTINSESVDKIGAFRFYKRPIFPYVIGNYFKSKPIEFNFSKFSNQDDFDFKEEKLLRNTSVYNLTSQTSGYDYVLDPNAVKNQISEVKDTSSGYVKSLGITTGGNSYQVGDKILFDSSGVNVFAEVSYIGGKDITQISVASTSVSNIEVYKIPNSSNNFIGFSSIPHNLLNGDTVRFTSK